MRATVFLLLLLMTAAATPAQACGPDSDCQIGDRIYRIKMPDGHDGTSPVGAIVFAHGYRGTAAGIMANENLVSLASELGVALIGAKSASNDWSIANAPSDETIEGVDEVAYFERLLDDASERFPINRNRVMATGFSAGGMMVWTLACDRSDLFSAYAPMAGVFWRPIPETCASPPTSVMHIHGDDDKIVPLEGRPIQDTHQGNVHDVMAMYARHGSFGDAKTVENAGMRCEQHVNTDGHFLDFCLFSGGHSFSIDYLRFAWERFEQAGKL
ncbi:MAG: alpha/beta hydrolase family esterase [Geminicoccaceae bacterium]